MSDLFDISPEKKAEPRPDVVMSQRWLPVRCSNPKCGATYGEPQCYRSICMLCDAETESILWHDYVLSLLKYTPCHHHHDKIRKLAEDMDAEHKKTIQYIALMQDKPGFDAGAAMDTHNQNAQKICQDFEEKMWEGDL